MNADTSRHRRLLASVMVSAAVLLPAPALASARTLDADLSAGGPPAAPVPERSSAPRVDSRAFDRRSAGPEAPPSLSAVPSAIRWRPVAGAGSGGTGGVEAWFAWAATEDGEVAVRVDGDDPSIELSVLSGEPEDLHVLRRGARAGGSGGPEIRFDARSGVTYRVHVTGKEGAGECAIAAQPIGRDYVLRPYGLHLSMAGTSSAQLGVFDRAGNPVTGGLAFYGYDSSLVSVSETGLVTALRAEEADEIGTWILASVSGMQVDNAAVVRVLSADPEALFAEHPMLRSVVWSPTEVEGEDLETHVLAHQIPQVVEYVYAHQRNLMGTDPFGTQVLGVDFGESESGRVCGISGNPVRLGWNLNGSEWSNCFLVPFVPPRSPQWFIFHHEIGHNTTWSSGTFGQGLGHFLYSEGLASFAALTSMARILDSPDLFPLGATAAGSLGLDASQKSSAFAADYAAWLAAGADFAALDPNIVDGLLLARQEAAVACFAERFFNLIEPRYQPILQNVLDAVVTDADRHTFFAAAVSAAAQSDLHALFAGTYHYPLNETLYPEALAALQALPTTAAPSPVAPADGATRQEWPVELRWESTPGALAYDLYFGVVDPPALFAQGLFETRYRFDTLAPGTTHYWQVEAHHPCAGALSGPVASFTTAPFLLELLFDNGPRSGNCCSEMTRYTLAEDFELATSERLVSVRYAMEDETGVFPANWDGVLGYWIFRDQAGFPGDLLDAGAGVGIDVQDAGDGSYEVRFDLAQPFDARPGRRYWLALHMTADWGEEHGLRWALTESGFGELARFDDGSGASWSDSGHHLAFALLGDPRYLFADGFEGGDTSDWSAALPGSP